MLIVQLAVIIVTISECFINSFRRVQQCSKQLYCYEITIVLTFHQQVQIFCRLAGIGSVQSTCSCGELIQGYYKLQLMVNQSFHSSALKYSLCIRIHWANKKTGKSLIICKDCFVQLGMLFLSIRLFYHNFYSAERNYFLKIYILFY